jgi:hypothetical protein
MKNNSIMYVLTFVAGAIIGAAIFWISCSYCCKSSCCAQTCGPGIDTTGFSRIDVATASTYFQNYMADPVKIDTLRAVTISPEQYQAMKMIEELDSTVHGFRIYMGMKDSLTPVRIVIGTGSPERTDNIFVTTRIASRLCPPVCDVAIPFDGKY